MRIASLVIALTTLAALAGLVALLMHLASGADGPNGGITGGRGPANGPRPTLRIGLIPERDIFAQRKRYQALAAYVEQQTGQPVTLVTLNAYESALQECADDQIDACFTGSMLAVLAYEHGTLSIVAKPELEGGVTTYHGVLIVPPDSAIQTPADLKGKRLAMVKLTTAGELFAGDLLVREGLTLGEGPDAVAPVWVGTHDEVIREVLAGRADAGAVKNLRLDAYEAAEGVSLRRLARSGAVPNNALLICHRIPEPLRQHVRRALLTMHEREAGRAALEAFGATRFVPCANGEYAAVYDMLERLGPAWQRANLPNGLIPLPIHRPQE